MKNLILHIEYLLLRHDCVIVPGLGAFIAENTPARIDPFSSKILPPSRSVMFNQAVTSDDGLLTNSIARRDNLTFEDARQVVFYAVTSLKKELQEVGEVALGKIGTLTLGEENTLVFHPSAAADSISVMPGLEEITYEKALYNYEDEAEETTYRKKGFLRRFGKAAAAVAAVIAVVCAALLYPLPTDTREQKASVVPVDAMFFRSMMEERPRVKATEMTDSFFFDRDLIYDCPEMEHHYPR